MISRNTFFSSLRSFLFLGMLLSSLTVSALSQLGTDFVGTTTNADFIFNQNNAERMRITTGGYVKIATSGGYLDYRPNNIACTAAQVLAWSGGINAWVCSNDSVGISGSGLTTNYLTKWNGTVVANSQVFDNGTRIGIATIAPGYTLDLSGTLRVGTGSDFTLSGKYITYNPGGTACTNGQILSYSTANSRWQCGTDSQGVSGTGASNALTKWTLSGTTAVLTGSTALFESGNYLQYSPGAVACTNGQLLSYNLAQNRWECATYSQGVTGTGSNTSLAKWTLSGGTLILSGSSDIFETGGFVGIGTSAPQSQLHIDSGISGVSGVRFSQLNASTTPTLQSNAAIGVDASGNLVAIPPGNVAVYTGISRTSPPTPNPNSVTQEVGYDFNNYFNISGKATFVVTNGSSPAYNGPYFQENGSSTPCSWNGTYGTSPVDCITTDQLTGLSASPYNSFTMTAKGDSFGYQLALAARGDAPLFARAGRYVNNGTTNIGSGLYLNDGIGRTPSPWMKILVAPASHPEYFYINTGYNSQWVATTGTGFIGIGTSFPDIHFVVTSSGTVGSADRVMAIRRGFAGADSSMVTTYGTPYLLIGGRETRTNSIQTIGFGYNTTTSFQPAEIGFLTTSTTGNTQGSIVFANRNGTTNVAPTEVMRITSTGAVGIGTAIPNAGLDLSGTLRVADGSQGLGKILTSDASGYATWASPSNNSTQSYTGARYVSYMSSPQATTLNTPVNIPQLTSINIPPGYYSFRIIAKFRSSATGNGMGLTLTNGTATMTGFIAEQRAQRTTILNDPASLIAPGDMNVGTASPAANTDYFSMVEGGFQVTATGTVIAQFQSEVSGNTTTLQPGSFMVIEALTNSFGLTGLGTQNYVTKLDALGGITMSQIFDTGTGVGIGTTSPGAKLDVSGDALINGITVGKGSGQIIANTAFGYLALNNNTIGYGNTSIGFNSLSSNTSGSYNNAIGQGTLTVNTTGSYNFTNGVLALANNTSGSFNIADGFLALRTNTTGSGNVAIGTEALYAASTVDFQTAVGYQALKNSTTGLANAAFGYRTLYLNTTGYFNTANGYQALNSNDTGFMNTANGYQALYSNTGGLQNAAFGYQSLYSNTTGQFNTSLGNSALSFNSTGYQNTAVGSSALGSNSTGYNNTAIGRLADVGAGNLSNATAIGANAVVSASNSLILGNGANVGIGTSTPSNKLTVVGGDALINGVTVGRGAGSNGGPVIGSLALVNNTTGLYNVALGNGALYYTTSGDFNTAAGNEALTANTTGYYNTAYGYNANGGSSLTGMTTSYNSYFGAKAGRQAKSANSTIIGYGAGLIFSGSNNTFLGYQAGDALTVGSNNIVIGYDIDTPSTTSNNTLNIGNLLFGTSIDGTNTTLSSGNIGIGTSAPGQKLTVSGSIQMTDGNQAAGKVFTSDASGVGSWQALGTTNASAMFSNMGQPHGTQTDFNVPTDFGFRYIQGSTNGPGIASATQYYNMSIGLGSDYPYSQYAMQFAIPRTPVGGNPYPSVRFREAGSWGSWSKIYAGYADTVPASGITGLTSMVWTLSGSSIGSNDFLGSTNALPLVIKTNNTTRITVASGASTAGAIVTIAGGDAVINGITFGMGSGQLNSNVVAGNGSLRSNTSGYENTALGKDSLYGNTSGAINTAIGYRSLFLNTTGYSNTALGDSALYTNGAGYENTAVGYYALGNLVGSSNNNTALGINSLFNLASGTGNIALGNNAAINLTSGSGNIALGSNTTFASTTGSNQLNIGNLLYGTGLTGGGAGYIGIGTSSPTSKLTVVGGDALINGMTIGRGPGQDSGNTVVGWYFTTGSGGGSWNTSIGRQAQPNLGAGSWNTAVGGESLSYNTIGNYNTAVGYNANGGSAASSTGSYNSFFGSRSGRSASTDRSTIIGYGAGLIFSGSNNTFLGYQAGDALTVGSNNIVIGYDIDTPSTTSNNTLNIGNLLFGTSIDGTNTTLSSGNIGIGIASPTLAKLQVVGSIFGYSDNIFLAIDDQTSPRMGFTKKAGYSGMFAHSNNTSFSIGMTNATTIDPAGYSSITQQLVVDTGGNVGINTTSPSEKLHVVGNVLATSYLYISDRRLKKDIESITGSGAEDVLERLQGVRFKWKSDDRSDIGFIAQDVEKVLPELVHTGNDGMKSVQYGNIIPLLVEGYKSEKARADSLQSRLDSLESRIESLEKNK